MDTYEKKYNEALDRARNLMAMYPQDAPGYKEVFPELRESEDERIRKLLVWQVYRNIEDETNDLAQSVYDGIKGHDPDLEESIEDWKKCLAYLEKQKESLHIPEMCKENADSFTSEDEKIRKELISHFEAIKLVNNQDMFHGFKIDNILAWLEKQKDKNCLACDQHLKGYIAGRKVTEEEKQKEQKPAEWSDYKDKVNVPYCSSEPEWSEEDEKMLNDCIMALSNWRDAVANYGHEVAPCQELIDWLKSLRPPKDCSGCSKHLEGYISGRGDAENKLLDQFGILITPEGELHMKPRWKPSEEHLSALLAVLNDPNNIGSQTCQLALTDLYEQLKKL